MRILLRDDVTGLFYFGQGHWTPSRTQAYDFHSGDHAMSVAERYAMARGEMIFDFDDPNVTFGIPLVVSSVREVAEV
jgi:hypothetical protein